MVFEQLLQLVSGVVEHVEDAAVSGLVYCLIGRDEHCERPRSTKRRRSTAVVDQGKETVKQIV